MWCVYLTIYSGNKLPPFYLGSTSIKKIEKGYLGSVSSKLYEETWKTEIKENRHLFNIRILKTFEERKDALKYENHLQKSLCMSQNSLYINRSSAFGPDIPWNRGLKGVQVPWNKGLKGVQVPWNKGIPSPTNRQRLLTNNPMKDEKTVNKLRLTVFKGRSLYMDFVCLHCQKTEVLFNTKRNMKRKFCSYSCSIASKKTS